MIIPYLLDPARGCPFVGFHHILQGSTKLGPEPFYYQQSHKLRHVPIWKFFFLGQGVVNLTGSALIQQWFVREFDGVIGSKPPTPKELAKRRSQPSIFGTDNIAFERRKEEHSFLRRLVGGGIQNAKPLPTLQDAANKVIRRMQHEQRQQQQNQQSHTAAAMIAAHPYSVDYTMEFVQKHILGIRHGEHRAQVREALLVWMNALNSLMASLRIPFIIRRTKAYQARLFLEEQINQQIAYLETHGPDDSILSAMLFARDDDAESTRLERPQVVENALFLVAAGAETSANTLTLALLLLGLHPEKYQKLVQEQAAFVDDNDTTTNDDGTTNIRVTQDELQQSPYLDAIVHEALRMGPVSGGFPRKVRETITIDGYQVPKGWSIFGSIRLTHQLDLMTWQPDLAHMNPYRGFAPERWLDPSTKPQEFIPFGVGARYCLGANLALLELKVFLATFARIIPSFTLPVQASKKDIEWDKRSIIPRPKDGVLMTLANDGGGKGIESDQEHLVASNKNSNTTIYSSLD